MIATTTLHNSRIMASGFIDGLMMNRLSSAISIPIRFLVVSKISKHNPQRYFDRTSLFQFEDKDFADPTFNCPGRVDALIGFSTWALIVKKDMIKCFDKGNRFVAQQSQLGWVVSGCTHQSDSVKPLAFHLSQDDLNLVAQLEKFLNDDRTRERSADE